MLTVLTVTAWAAVGKEINERAATIVALSDKSRRPDNVRIDEITDDNITIMWEEYCCGDTETEYETFPLAFLWDEDIEQLMAQHNADRKNAEALREAESKERYAKQLEIQEREQLRKLQEKYGAKS